MLALLRAEGAGAIVEELGLRALDIWSARVLPS
jgi:hypothetical protein